MSSAQHCHRSFLSTFCQGVHTQDDSLEKTLLKFCKLLLGVPNSATTDAVLGELGRFPLWLFTQFRAVQYWVRCSVGEPPELVMESHFLRRHASLVQSNLRIVGQLSEVKAWVGLTAAKIARAVHVCTRHRMLCNCGLLNTATLMFTFA